MNKRLVIIFACIAVFVLILVVGAVVFTVSDVNILLSSEQTIAFDKTKILQTSGIKKGQSVFTIDAEEASGKIEKQFPMLKVVKIERVFPNKVRINLDVRTPIIKVKIAGSDNYCVMDRELKIVAIVDNDSDTYEGNNLLSIENYEYTADENCLGDFASGDKTIDNIKEILGALETRELVNSRVPATFEKFVVESEAILMQSKLGIMLLIRTNTDRPCAQQCDALYLKFYGMSSDEREQPNYIYIGNNGSIIVSPNIKFD